jgi:hypothetical protein
VFGSIFAPTPFIEAELRDFVNQFEQRGTHFDQDDLSAMVKEAQVLKERFAAGDHPWTALNLFDKPAAGEYGAPNVDTQGNTDVFCDQ